nr:MAG TPA_asm: hypothetical protein [Caudoviricetes sp.]
MVHGAGCIYCSLFYCAFVYYLCAKQCFYA